MVVLGLAPRRASSNRLIWQGKYLAGLGRRGTRFGRAVPGDPRPVDTRRERRRPQAASDPVGLVRHLAQGRPHRHRHHGYALHLFENGANRWVDVAAWPPSPKTGTFYLGGNHTLNPRRPAGTDSQTLNWAPASPATTLTYTSAPLAHARRARRTDRRHDLRQVQQHRGPVDRHPQRDRATARSPGTPRVY